MKVCIEWKWRYEHGQETPRNKLLWAQLFEGRLRWPRVKFYSRFHYFSIQESFLEKFLFCFKASNNQIEDKKNWNEFSSKTVGPEIKFHINPGLS